jgi:hypothetical protein
MIEEKKLLMVVTGDGGVGGGGWVAIFRNCPPPLNLSLFSLSLVKEQQFISGRRRRSQLTGKRNISSKFAEETN